MPSGRHCLGHKATGHLLNRTIAQQFGNPIIVQFVEKTVAAQQEAVTAGRGKLPTVNGGIDFDSQSPGEDVALGMDSRLLGSQFPSTHQIGHQAVVIADPHKFV